MNDKRPKKKEEESSIKFKRKQQLVDRIAFDNDVLGGSTTSYRALLSHKLTKFHRSIIVINTLFFGKVCLANACIELLSERVNTLYSVLSTQYAVYAVCDILSALFSIKYCQIGCNALDNLTVESR